jgi:hypothetical protein
VTGPYPALRAPVLDTTDARALGEFYRQLLGFTYRPRDVAPTDDGAEEPPPDWLVLLDDAGTARLAIQRVDVMARPTWPDPTVPQQLHLDLTVGDVAELARQRARALALGATELEDRSGDPDEPLHVLADPAGHPFCIFVSPDHPG